MGLMMEAAAPTVPTGIPASIGEAFTSAWSTTDIVTMVSAVLGIVLVYAVTWFVIRYAMKKIKKGVLRGKVSA